MGVYVYVTRDCVFQNVVLFFCYLMITNPLFCRQYLLYELCLKILHQY